MKIDRRSEFLFIAKAAVLLLVSPAALPQTAAADPEPNQIYRPGAPDPLATTAVEMVSEKVTFSGLSRQKLRRGIGGEETDWAFEVEGRFALRNTSAEAERILVSFPFCQVAGGVHRLCDTTNVEVLVDGRKISHQTAVKTLDDKKNEWVALDVAAIAKKLDAIEKEGGEDAFEKGYDVATADWYLQSTVEFEISFPGNTQRELVVRYRIKRNDHFDRNLDGENTRKENAPVYFEYTLHTGAGWHGTIGQGEISVELPYGAGPETVYFAFGTGRPYYYPERRIGFPGPVRGGRYAYALKGNRATLSFSNLEPERFTDDLAIFVMTPKSYDKWRALQAQLKRKPKSEDLRNRMLRFIYDSDIDWFDPTVFFEQVEGIAGPKPNDIEGALRYYRENARYVRVEYIEQFENALAEDPKREGRLLPTARDADRTLSLLDSLTRDERLCRRDERRRLVEQYIAALEDHWLALFEKMYGTLAEPSETPERLAQLVPVLGALGMQIAQYRRVDALVVRSYADYRKATDSESRGTETALKFWAEYARLVGTPVPYLEGADPCS